MSPTHAGARASARMVDVGMEPVTRRQAVARSWVVMNPETLALIETGAVPSGDVLATARVAGIMAAKRTAELIPLCHPLPLDYAAVDCLPDTAANAVQVTATVYATARSSPALEALTAASAAALTIYDMCEAIDRSMHIESLRLLRESGGRGGTWELAKEEAERRPYGAHHR